MQTNSAIVAVITASLELTKLSLARDNSSRGPDTVMEHFKKHYKDIIDVIKENPINSGNQPQ